MEALLVVAASPLLGERVDRRGWAAVLLGFCGMLLALRPQAGGDGAHLAVLAAGGLAARDLLTRQLSAEMPSTLVAVLGAASVTAAAGAWASIAVALAGPSGADDRWPSAPVPARGDLLLLAIASGLILLAYLGNIVMMRLGDVQVVQPFRYSLLLWATLLGVLLFDQWPDAWTVFGAALIVACGVLSWRDRRQAPPPAVVESSVFGRVPDEDSDPE